MRTRVAILVLPALLCACRSAHNDRSAVGEPGTAAAVTLTGVHGVGDRSETRRSQDGPSMAGLSRAGWARQTISVPVDGTYAFHRYMQNYRIADETARQRGDYPTPLSSLELTGGTTDDQALEILAVGPNALYEGLVLVPRMFFVQPWDDVRATPSPYWRAPVNTPRFSRDEREPAATGSADPAAAPN